MLRSGDLGKRRRVPDVDFWRGFALVVILIDHVPPNVLDRFTPQNFGFSDAAEAFVFISGVSVGLAYLPMFQKAGFGWLVGRCARRAITLYFAQIALALAGVAIAVAASKIVGDDDVAASQGFSSFLESPISSLLGVTLLTYQPGYSTILPMYVVFMLWAPVVLVLALRSPILALLASTGIYAVGRAHGGVQPSDWSFNPLTWQLVFSIGVVCALTWRQGLPRPQRLLVVLASAVVLVAAILSVKAIGLKPVARAHLDLDKSDLGLARLIHFAALAYLITGAAVARPWGEHMARIVGGPIGRSLQGMGRNSLLFFAFGSLLSAVGRSLLVGAYALGTRPLFVHFIGLAYTTTAVAGMFALVHRIDRTRKPRPGALADGWAIDPPHTGVSLSRPSLFERDGGAILPGAEPTARSTTLET